MTAGDEDDNEVDVTHMHPRGQTPASGWFVCRFYRPEGHGKRCEIRLFEEGFCHKLRQMQKQ